MKLFSKKNRDKRKLKRAMFTVSDPFYRKEYLKSMKK